MPLTLSVAHTRGVDESEAVACSENFSPLDCNGISFWLKFMASGKNIFAAKLLVAQSWFSDSYKWC